MNADEIHALSDRGLCRAIERKLWSNRRSVPVYSKVYMISRDLSACHEAEERLAEMGLATAFTVQLYLVAVEAQKADGRRHPIRWYEVHAPARDRAEAILMAAQEKESE